MGGYYFMKTRPLTIEEYELIIKTIYEGFEYIDSNNKKKKFRPNQKLGFLLQLQANLGIRVGDMVKLKLSDFVPNGKGGYKIDIIEEKTLKRREFNIPNDLYMIIKLYALENKIKKELFYRMGERNIQQHLKVICNHLGLENISTHSFRKFYAMRIFEDNNYNIEIVRRLLKHSNIGVTQKYLGIESKEVERAIQNHKYWVVNQ